MSGSGSNAGQSSSSTPMFPGYSLSGTASSSLFPLSNTQRQTDHGAKDMSWLTVGQSFVTASVPAAPSVPSTSSTASTQEPVIAPPAPAPAPAAAPAAAKRIPETAELPTSVPPSVPVAPQRVGKDAYEQHIFELMQQFSSSSSDMSDSDAESTKKKKEAKKKRKREKKKEKKKRRKKDVSDIESHKKQKTDPLAAHDGVLALYEGPDDLTSESLALAKATDESIFVTDTMGDKENLEYQSLFRQNVPLFFRMDRSTLLGVKSFELRKSVRAEIDAELGHTKRQKYHTFIGDPKEVKAKPKSRYTAMKAVKKLTDRTVKKIDLSRKMNQPQNQAVNYFDPSQEYIPFASGERQLAVKGDQSRVPVTAVEEGESVEEYIMRRTKELNELTREQATDLDVWLRFLRFQDESSGFTQVRNQAVIDKKLSILERALESLPNSTQLLLLYLRYVEERWETDKVTVKWEHIIRKNIRNRELWIEYLRFRQTQYSRFSVTAIRELYTKCLADLSKERQVVQLEVAKATGTAVFQSSSVLSEGPELRNMECLMLDVFCRACDMERMAGYEERAIGMYQGMVEFTCFCPTNIENEELPQKLSEFEKFWESEACRIGEDGVIVGWDGWLKETLNPTIVPPPPVEPGGWSGWNESGADADSKLNRQAAECTVNVDEQVNATAHANVAASVTVREFDDRGQQLDNWRQREEEIMQRHWMPVRPIAQREEAEEAPDRVVLFDDIREYLFTIRSKELKKELLFRFLEFMGAPTGDRHSSNDSESIRQMDHSDSASSIWGFDALGDIRGFSDMRNVKDSFYQDGELQIQISDQLKALGSEKTRFIRNIFKQAMNLFKDDPVLLALALRVESTVDLKNARSIAQSVLKIPSNRSNLILYHLYGEMESSNGAMKEARKVFSTALTLSSKLPPAQNVNAPLLVWSYAKMEILAAQKAEDRVRHVNNILHILAAAAEGQFEPIDESTLSSGLPPTKILKIRNAFRELISASFASPASTAIKANRGYLFPGSPIGCSLLCFVWFEALTVGAVKAAAFFTEYVKQYQELSDSTLKSRSDSVDREFEWLWNEFFSLLQSDLIYTIAVTPRLFRRSLEMALSRFPYNRRLLSLYIEGEERSRIANRLRQFFDEQLKRASSSLLWIFAIGAELTRFHTSQLEYTGSNRERVRSLFETAMDNPQVGSSVALWRLYLQFEVVLGSGDSAKRVFYRAINKCPFAKTLWLDAIRYRSLRNLIDEEEMNQVIELVTEKEIRFHIDPIELAA